MQTDLYLIEISQVSLILEGADENFEKNLFFQFLLQLIKTCEFLA